MMELRLTVGTILLVGVLHLPAVLFDWYFYFWWYDVLMHGLGGVAMGFLACTLWSWLNVQGASVWKTNTAQLIFVLGFVAMIGIGWEWAEGIVDAVALPNIGMTQLGLTDTMLDLFFDLVGGLIAWLVIHVKIQKDLT